MRYDITKIQVEAIVTMLRDEFAEDDERLLLDTLEGETDLFEMTGKLLGWIEQDEGAVTALKAQVDDRTERRRRFEARIAAKRDAVMALLDCAGLDKLQLPEATISVRALAPKPIVANEEALPDEYCRVKRTPDMAAIKAGLEAGATVPGVTLDNGGRSITIRRK